MLSVVVLSHVVNDGVHRECLLYDSDSKFLLFFRTAFYFLLFFSELLFTFYFFFLELLFNFYFLELLYFFSFTYVLFLVSTRTSNPPHLPSFVSEALFCLCRGTNIYNSLGGASEFQDTYQGFLFFLTFLFFLSGFFILLVREKHRKTLYRFFY